MLPWYIWALGAALLWTVEVLFEKKLLFKQHVVQFLTVYSIILFALALPFVGRVNFELPWLVYGVIFVNSVIWVTSLILLYKALRHLEVSNSIPFENLSVLVVVSLGIFFLGESLKWLNVVGIACLIGGGFLLCLEKRDLWSVFHPRNKRFFWLAIVGNVLLGCSVIIDKVVLSPGELGLNWAPVDPFSVLFLIRLFACLNLLFLTFCVYKGLKDIKEAWKQGWAFIIFAAAFNNLAFLFYYTAMASAYVALVDPIVSLYIFLDVVLGGRVFHEHHVTKRLIACALMLVGAYLVVI